MKTPKLIIIDGNSLIHRGFHAIPYLSTSKGQQTNGVYGFVSIFFNALKKIQPEYIAVAFDLEGPTFRDEMYAEYKAKRAKAPQELYDQIPLVKKFITSLRLPIFEHKGFEADDIIGTIVRNAPEEIDKVIVTGDLDSLQLIDASTKVFTTKKGLTETVEYDSAGVEARYGFGPEYVIDYKALRGDASDNIPGIPGIGEKGATELIQKFGHIEELYRELEKNSKKANTLPRKLRERLVQYKDQCLLCLRLATIRTDAPIKFDLEKTRFGAYEPAKALKFLQEMEFKSLIAQLPRPRTGDQPAGAEDPEPGGKFISSDYHLIADQGALDALVGKLEKSKGFVFDCETTSEREMEAELLGVSIACKSKEAYYVPMRSQQTLASSSLDTADLKKLFSVPAIQKWAHNAKYDYLVLRRHGIEVSPISFDTMISAYVLNPGSRSYSLDNLVFTRFGYQMMPIEALIGKGKKQITMADVPIADVAQYSSEDADYTLRLKGELEPELKEQKLDAVFREIDIPLIPVLAQMEENGIRIDPAVFKRLSKKVDADLENIKQKIYKLGHGEFNINSPQQLKEILFTKLQISTAEIKKTKTGLSTAASELGKMKDAHPIIPLIMEYRELAKLKSTYIDELPSMVNRATGRIHSSFNQTIAATGRLSSTDPNLQNIPIRTELGNKIREGFIAEKGYRLLALDYSQIELRVVAHLSGDRVMQKVFREGKDIHTATAAEVFEIAEKKVGATERRYAKIINFGVLYGLSAYGFTQQVPGVSHDKAQAFIDKYFLTYQGVKQYIDDIVEQARKDGFVTNELGRKRYLPEINSSQFPVRSGAERAAINTPIQSLAADIIKVAMINIAHEIGVQNQDCKMLLQVHDELVFEVRDGKIKEYGPKIKKLMESAIKLSVPVEVEAKEGGNWGEMKETKF
ncbi:MAG: DNA polymerase I [Candidatus Doudnabacteria bacterium RIFCSPHIGHO2_01_FULL_50_11]|uniref:DNA polymerase I n=1 Tax=Candidatus Doudnabacteria bacterium RIFCSPHIGHO2_01_FULL_50_11 TaxID=1817828 RepID=A0A1F5PHQ8_9BACT|nr:MAG: DNA polymerase I [Candidatus Doudnabacteria bacterium RIFCSPHIGHO2_01_FULL_50_11]HLC44917.1 DNA polymerase I [Patescibacteria group bacterium]